MSTPAEIIAARANGIYSENGQDQSNDFDYEEEVPKSQGSTKSISDENAYPTLGGGKTAAASATPSTWGPSMKTPVSASAPARKVPSGGNKIKASTIQDAFSLNEEDQLNVARPEFNKILNSVKTETKTSIESSVSQHTKKRTFLISGKPEEVKLAKRLIIKKLTKPTQVVFTIPAKIRSKVIGPQGKTLKPILQQNEVKIDIGNVEEGDDEEEDDEENVFGKSIKVTIDGDVEGAKHAKNQIMAIVKEETKNLSVKVKVDDLIKPFVAKALQPTIAKYDQLEFSVPDYKSNSSLITIIGERELIVAAKEEIKEVLADLHRKIVIEEVPIPKIKYQFLPIDEILHDENVLIKLPSNPDANVEFIGEAKKINFAQERARKVTSQYKVEVLDMSKAHKGNLKHVKAVATLLNQNGTFEQIAKDNEVSINAPTKKQLTGADVTSIPIEIIVKADEVDKTKKTKSAIVSVVNKITPDQTKIVSDIDAFFINKVADTIKDSCQENNVKYVILNNEVILIHLSAKESDDFEDFEDSSEQLNKVDESLNKLRDLAKDLQSITLTVESKDQSHVSGPRDTTLKSILGNVDGNSVVVQLHTPKDNEITIKGLKSQVDVVKKEIESVIADAIEHKDGYKQTIEVPSAVLPRLIGKNGQNMNELRTEFGVKIDTTDDKESKEKSEKATIEIVGIKRNVEAAKLKVNSMSKKWADETLERIKVDSKFHKRMIGPKGVYINRLQDKYNVRIRFPNENELAGNFNDSPKHKDEVTIKGPSKGVSKAVEELNELFQFEKENGFTQTIQIPSKSIARVIGKAGETIKDISDGTGIEYRFNRDTEKEKEQGYADLELTGTKSGLKEAISKIEEIIEEVENHITVKLNVARKYHRELIGQGGSKMKQIIAKAGGDDLPKNKYYRLLSIPNEGDDTEEIVSSGDKSIVEKVIEIIKEIVAEKEASVTEEITLLKEKHKFIVGPQGSIRHSLQDEFGVTIEIPRPHDESNVIKVTGLPEKVEAVKEKIAELTKDNFNESIDVPESIHSLVSERGAIFKKLRDDYGVEVQHGNSTRKASKLSNGSIPNPPESAYLTEEESEQKTKFTIVDGNLEISETTIPWRLKGDKEQTAKVAKLINERVEQAKEAKKIGWFYAVQPSIFSKIIGPQGAKVTTIRKETGCFITIPRNNDKNNNFIYLTGNEDNLLKAKAEFEKLV